MLCLCGQILELLKAWPSVLYLLKEEKYSACITHASWLQGWQTSTSLAQPHLSGPDVELVTSVSSGNKFNLRPTQVGLS